MKIVHVVSSLKIGGMEQFVLRIARAQKKRGHEVRVLALQGGPLTQETALTDGVQLHVLGGGMLKRMVGATAFFVGFQPDIINAHNPSSLHYAALGKRVSRGYVVMTYHGKGLGDPRKPGADEWKRTDAIVTVSGATAEVIREDLPEVHPEIVVILNGIDPTPAQRSREEVRAELGLGEGWVGTVVARVDPLKDHRSLLEAVHSLRQEGTELSLLIVGDGPERANLEALSAQLGLQDRVHFLGFRHDVPDLLGASDLFVLPSTTEGLPLSVLEAMAHGLPVVATAVGGVPELVEEGRSGLLVPPRDPSALAQAIGSLLRDPQLRENLGRNAAHRALNEFSFEGMVDRYEELYHRLIAK